MLVPAIITIGNTHVVIKSANNMWSSKVLWMKCDYKYELEGDNRISILSYIEGLIPTSL